MAKRRKQKHYLDALADPALPPERRMALNFLFEVDIIRAADDLAPRPTDFTQEEQELRTNIRCANCYNDFRGRQLYCSDECQQIVKTVRYIRKAETDQRIVDPDVQIGIGMQLFMLTGGGYPAKERALSKERRGEILERDQYKCKLCGKPADQVDHIDGDSGDPINLRALCGECNRKEALSNTVAVTDDEAKRTRELFHDIAMRVASTRPIYLCDDSAAWAKIWPSLSGVRRHFFRELEAQTADDNDGEFEDVDGYLYDAMQKDD